ncbi:hypothetical protein E2C01_026823 [Portunus trituberculatus]|uniref:Uncharacterized protein n=1 Tax=Portunus trituberculatus TaxID=210409 RepID=A0A5B7EH50_PORTR|nr:hypothetical protein [Portunus trituberculatus]
MVASDKMAGSWELQGTVPVSSFHLVHSLSAASAFILCLQIFLGTCYLLPASLCLSDRVWLPSSARLARVRWLSPLAASSSPINKPTNLSIHGVECEGQATVVTGCLGSERLADSWCRQRSGCAWRRQGISTLVISYCEEWKKKKILIHSIVATLT